jgi:4-hydroxybenzoate polyprenyltransferase
METHENSRSFFARFIIYQKERFPFFQHGILIIAFTFSSVNYSLNARNGTDTPDWQVWITGAVTSFLFFFLLRLFDEFKDAEDDGKYRPYRPVPRGLVSFPEVRAMIIFSLAVIIILNAILIPRMLPIIFIVLLYLTLMTKEFFVPQWLKSHPVLYMTSHMFIMPLFDLYTTGLDWHLQKEDPSEFLLLFLIISFFNGMVIEQKNLILAKLLKLHNPFCSGHEYPYNFL